MKGPSEREKILSRVRDGLRTPAPRPHDSHTSLGPTSIRPSSSAFRQWLPAVGEGMDERLKAFQANALSLKADFHLLDTEDELVERLSGLRDAEGWTRIATHAGELLDAIGPRLNLPMCRTDRSYAVAELEGCQASMTQCDALVAQTGSVLVTSRSAGGRALSVLPPHHVVLARRAQLVRDLPEAFSLLKATYAPQYPSFISFITGPSRTGDIERILVLGAHGPKKLTIFCL